MNDDASAEKADAGQDPLNDTAGGVGKLRGVTRRVRQHHDHRGRKAYQSKRSQSDRLAVQIAVEADQPARKRGGAQPQHDLLPVEHAMSPSNPPYFGKRPIK